MDKEDARYQTLEQLHERRKQVIRLHKRGIKVMELVQMSGLSYPAVFYLPSYSPQLNPEDRLNADLKQAMGKRVPVRTQAKLRDAANEHMAMLEKSPERVMSFFQDPRVKYAAS